jgi:hypothetical protein
MTAGVAQGGIDIPGGAVVVNDDAITVVVEITDAADAAVVAAASDVAGGDLADNEAAVAESEGIPNGGFNWALVIPVCQPITVPPENDRGTSQYAGPSETPYGIPSPTIVDTLILETNCWNLYRRSTKTYSSRSVANGYSTNLGYLAASAGGFHIYTGLHGFGATISDMKSSVAQNNYGVLGAEEGAGTYFPPNGVYPDGYQYRLINKRPGAGEIAAYYDYYTFYGTSYQGERNYSAGYSGAASRPTLYYLDYVEVWSYYII